MFAVKDIQSATTASSTAAAINSNPPQWPLVAAYNTAAPYGFVTDQNKLFQAHLTVRPFACPRCAYSFADKSRLMSHLKKHSDDVYPFRCDACPFKSKFRNNWKAHLETDRHYNLTVSQKQQQQQQQQRYRRGPVVLPPGWNVTELADVGPAATSGPAVHVPGGGGGGDGTSSFRFTAADRPRRDAPIGFRVPDGFRAVAGTTDTESSIACSENDSDGGRAERLACKFCDVAFAENVLYVTHIGYHCFGEPLTCNLCGEVMDDKFSFLKHIAHDVSVSGAA